MWERWDRIHSMDDAAGYLCTAFNLCRNRLAVPPSRSGARSRLGLGGTISSDLEARDTVTRS